MSKPTNSVALTLKHAEALIELLSVVDGDMTLELGLDAQTSESLEDVFERACDFYEQVIGRPHPLANPSPADDAEVAGIKITHDNPGSLN